MRWMTIPLGALVLFAGAAVAADASLDAARRCTQLKDSLERLVCYDRALATAPAAAAAPAAAPAMTAPVVVAAPAAVPTPAAVPSLGEDSIKRKAADKADKGPTSLTAKVAGLKETRENIYRITLDNGQIWQQMDLASLFFVKPGDIVEIRKGSMGGYRMGLAEGNGGGWVRVNRLK